jgi:rod shape determining protein RodA
VLKRLFARADFTLLITVVLLATFGAVMVASATRHLQTSGPGASSNKVLVQVVSLLVGLALMALVMSLDYNKLLHVAPLIIGGCLLMLVVTLVLGHAIRGSARWIPLGPVHLQPSEFTKIGVIILLSFYLGLRSEDSDLSSPKIFLQSLGLAAGPAFVILLQPDLGTPLVLFFVWMVIIFGSGGKALYLGGALVAAVLLFTVGWHTHLIKDYEKARIVAFLNPEADPLGAGYHLRQSLIAVGSGHLFGKGLFQGTQSNLAFLPDQETDFIFAVVGEELGFAGSLFVLGLLGIMIWRCFMVAAEAKDAGGRALALGIGAMFLMHVIVNVGMVLGMMPVKGLPLPFMSYGGSAMVANFVGIGIVESVYMRRHKIAF